MERVLIVCLIGSWPNERKESSEEFSMDELQSLSKRTDTHIQILLVVEF